MVAKRIGEATNPGPKVTIGFINPTALHGKVEHIKALAFDIVCTAENSATSYAILHLEKKLRACGYRQIWSPPVPPLNPKHQIDHAIRGQASGVSIHSKFPIRSTRMKATQAIDNTRLVSAIVQLGSIRFHIISIYGYPKCLPQANYKTNALMQVAAELVDQVGLPSMIVGDFNCPLEDLQAYGWFQAQGYRSTSELHLAKYSEEMPPTCRDTTTHDQFLIHPVFQPWITEVKVDKQKHFNDHDPVVVTMQFPTEIPPKQRWRQPDTWSTMEPQQEFIAAHFDHCKPDPTQNTLEQLLPAWQGCGKRCPSSIEATTSTTTSEISCNRTSKQASREVATSKAGNPSRAPPI